MGIQNRDGALFFASGIDNSGLRKGCDEAMGILKRMAGEITSFDIFGGLGISAGVAFAKAGKSAYDFEKQFQSNMLEVTTISDEVSGSLTEYMNSIIDMTKDIPILANDAAKGLYSIISAGHDGADGMRVLEAAAKGAIGGVSDTATAADGITTLLNAYKKSAEEAEHVSDMMFTAVKLGKTSFGELAQSISQAAPVAAAYGVEMDQLLAAVATLTKQGTPTAQAMTQIRSAIVGVSKYLGDGAYNSRTFQEALEEVRQKAGGSEAKLRDMITEMEAVNGLLSLTGKNATEAAGHLTEMNNAVGASETAFQKMRESGENQLQLLQNNITAALRPLGESILKQVSDIAEAFNNAFSNGDLVRTLETLQSMLEVGAVAWGTYKVAILLTTAAQIFQIEVSKGYTLAMQIEYRWLQIVTIAKDLLAKKTNTLTAAMMKNPYAIIAAGVAALGYGIYKLITHQTNAQKAQEKLNESSQAFTAEVLKETNALDSVFGALKKTKEGTEERKKLLNQINKEYGPYMTNMLTEKSTLADINQAYKDINDNLRSQIALKIKNQASTEMVTTEVNRQADALDKIRKKIIESGGSGIVADMALEEIQMHTKEFQAAGSNWQKAFGQAIHSVRTKFGVDDKGRKLNLDISGDVEKYIKSYYDMRYQQYQIDKKFNPFIKTMTTVEPEAEEEITPTTPYTKPDKKDYKGDIERAKKAQELLYQKMTLDLTQIRIDAEQEGEAKLQAQRDLDFQRELLAIQEKGEELIRAQQEIERKEWEEANKGKKESDRGAFIPKTTQTSQLPDDQRKLLEDLNLEAFNKYFELGEQARAKIFRSLISQLSDFKSQEETLMYEWNEKVKLAILTGDEDLITRTKEGKEKALRELNAQMLMESSEWIRLFGNLDTLTVEELDRLITNIQDKIDNGSLDLNPLDLKTVLERLGEAKSHIAKINPFEALKKSSSEMKSALGQLKQAEADGLTGDALDKYRAKVRQAAENVRKSLEGIRDAYGMVSDVMRDVADLISMVDEGLGETINNVIGLADAVINIGDVVSSAVIAFSEGMSTMETASVILLIIKAVITAVMAVINLFNNDKSHEKKIKALQRDIDNLQRAYERLGKAIEDAFSFGKVDLLEQQNENLLAQNEKIRQQIAKEKDKKKTDWDKIHDWENQIEDNLIQIQENLKKNTVEAIMGTEIRTAIEEFANAYADAWASGEKAAGKSANVVKKLIRTSIIDMLKNELQPEVTKFMTFLSEAMENDGVIDAYEQKQIDEYEKKLEFITDNFLKGKEKWLKDDDEQEDGVAGKLQAAMTQGTASELVGLWNLTAMDIRALKEMSYNHFEESRGCMINVSLVLDETRKIADNTLRSADNSDDIKDKLESISTELSEIKKNTKSYNGRGK